MSPRSQPPPHMPSPRTPYPAGEDGPTSLVNEDAIEYGFIGRLRDLKYDYRPDITDRASLEQNFRKKFEALNRVRLTDGDCPARQHPPTTRSHPAESERSDGQFARLLDEIVTPDVFTASKTLRGITAFTRDDAKFMNERDDIADYISTLQAGEGLSETAIRDGYTRFKAEKNAKELAAIASKHGHTTAALQTFVDGILDRMIFDGEQLGDLLAPLDLGWKARTQAELALMADLHPLLTKRAGGRDISGLSAYES